jgi:hypothetical protein
MTSLDHSFDEKDPVDVNSVIADIPNIYDDDDETIRGKKLSEAFDGCVPKGEDYMRVLLRVRPISSKSESTIVVESHNSILTNAPESSRRAQYTKTEARNYVSLVAINICQQ